MSKTDRELLELAAKAAGMRPGNGYGEYAWHPAFDCLSTLDERNRELPWNPLTDDGDEARIEGVLLMSVYWGMASVTVDSCTERFSDHGGDKQKARRYAGVRAAAAIGEAM